MFFQLSVRTHRSSRRVGAATLSASVIAVVTSAASDASGSVIFTHQNTQMTASWSGGVPINGFQSLSGHTGSTTSDPTDAEGGYWVELTGRVLASFAVSFYDEPLPPYGANMNCTYNYNGNFSDGTPDSSLRAFEISLEHSYFFSMNETMNWGRTHLVEGLAPFTFCEIQGPGSISQGVFSGGSVIDVTTTETATLAPGLYQFRSAFSTTFMADERFLLGTTTGYRLRPVPSPGAAVLATLGMAALACRRRR